MQQWKSPVRPDMNARSDDLGHRRREQEFGTGLLQGPRQPLQSRGVPLRGGHYRDGLDVVAADDADHVVEVPEHAQVVDALGGGPARLRQAASDDLVTGAGPQAICARSASTPLRLPTSRVLCRKPPPQRWRRSHPRHACRSAGCRRSPMGGPRRPVHVLLAGPRPRRGCRRWLEALRRRGGPGGIHRVPPRGSGARRCGRPTWRTPRRPAAESDHGRCRRRGGTCDAERTRVAHDRCDCRADDVRGDQSADVAGAPAGASYGRDRSQAKCVDHRSDGLAAPGERERALGVLGWPHPEGPWRSCAGAAQT